METKIPRGSHPDTHDLIFNPITERFEAVISAREASDGRMRLTLWSIAPERLLKGWAPWVFEGTLIASKSRYGPSSQGKHPPRQPGTGQDGFHPAASVVLPRQGKQLIFVYMAKSTDTFSSTFVIERTLDTGALSEYLLEDRSD